MEPGSQQSDCLSSTSSYSENSLTTSTQTKMPSSHSQEGVSKAALPSRSLPSQESLEGGKMRSPNPGYSEDEDSNADPNSLCSSTVEYEQESFETYQHKVTQLCLDIGYGEPVKIERMKGGGYNRIVGLEFALPEKPNFVLRIPRNGIEFDQPQDIKDQVATLNYVSQFLPVASVAAFDSTQNNAIASSYVLQERIHGVLMEDTFYDLPLAEKLQITTKIAELMIQMESIKLRTPGRVAASDDVPTLQHQQTTSPKRVKIYGYRSARFGSSTQFPDLEEAPFTPLIREILQHRKQLCILKDNPWMVEKMEMLQKIVSQMEEVELVRTTDRQCVMWHWDFAARNIMISRASEALAAPITHDHDLPIEATTTIAAALGEDTEGDLLSARMQTTSLDPWVITGVLDWDGILSVPLIVARQPPLWLWCNEKDRSSAWSGNLDIPPTRELTQDELLIKAHFDQIMAKNDPSYIDDAYHRGPWLRRLARFALFGFSEFGCFERYDAFLKDWEEHLSTITGNRCERSECDNHPTQEEAEDLCSDEDEEDGEDVEEAEESASDKKTWE